MVHPPMTMRKPTYAQNMGTLMNEIDTCEKFMAPLVREAEALDAARKTRNLTLVEIRRVDELTELIHEKNCWLVKAREAVGAYCAPASA